MISITNQRYKIFCILLSGIFLAFLTTAKAKPTLPFGINFSKSFRSLTTAKSGGRALSYETTTASSFLPSIQQFVEKRQSNAMKTYSGYRQDQDSLVMIYYHDQTIAIVELGAYKTLINCELIEIYNEKEGLNLLNKLSALNRPYRISFREMIDLMKKCQKLDVQTSKEKRTINDVKETQRQQQQNIFSGNPFSLLSGIIPGTKWCGTGDIAKTYSDIGEDNSVDRCCRTHDLCPVKVRAYQTRYTLENNSLYTKSHCVCDDMLYNCLKKSNSTSGQLMGTIYFNLIQVPCVTETKESGVLTFRRARDGF